MANYSIKALADQTNNVLWSQYGEVLRLVDSSSISMSYLTDVLKRPTISLVLDYLFLIPMRLSIMKFQKKILLLILVILQRIIRMGKGRA